MLDYRAHVGFSRAELEAFRDLEVADLIGPHCRLLFVGINPGLWTVATQTHFAHPTNRFYPALFKAGVVDRPVDPAAGMSDDDRRHLIERGIGITNLVKRATARASELETTELQNGVVGLTATVAEHKPAVVAIAGITAYRTAFGRAKARVGLQSEDIAGSTVWVVPNPSGLNAHENVDSLANWYAQAAVAAGIGLTGGETR